MLTLRCCTMSFCGKESKDQTEYVFALALLHYGSHILLHIGFSLKKFAGPQENP
jgi:hypothetical protein